MRRVINSKEITIISLYLNVTITIYYLNLSNYNFLFKSQENSILFLYIRLINKNIKAILIKNDSNKLINIQRNIKLENLSNLIINKYYHVIFD